MREAQAIVQYEDMDTEDRMRVMSLMDKGFSFIRAVKQIMKELAAKPGG